MFQDFLSIFSWNLDKSSLSRWINNGGKTFTNSSSYSSSVLGRTFALAMMADGRNQIGKFAEVPIGNSVARVEIVDSVFFDKENTRRDG